MKYIITICLSLALLYGCKKETYTPCSSIPYYRNNIYFYMGNTLRDTSRSGTAVDTGSYIQFYSAGLASAPLWSYGSAKSTGEMGDPNNWAMSCRDIVTPGGIEIMAGTTFIGTYDSAIMYLRYATSISSPYSGQGLIKKCSIATDTLHFKF